MNISFTEQVKKILKNIPEGRVATYGQIALLAGNIRGARQVAWILNSSSEKDKLPWHRVVNSKGKISLREGNGYELQRSLLEDEGIEFTSSGKINFQKYL